MIKRLYLINGTLLAPITATADDIAVDADTGAKLLAGLALGDYCYLTLISGFALEVIKVTRDFDGFNVVRGQAGTCKSLFPTGTQIVYKLTSAEIQDACNPAPVNIFGSGYGVAEVVNENGAWVVSLEGPQFECPGGIEASTTDQNVVRLTDKVGAFGCCDGSVTGAPGIDGPFFYLTTGPYAFRSTDGLTGQPSYDGQGNGPLLPINSGWLLTQPSLSEAIAASVSLADGALFGNAVTIVPTAEWVSSTVNLLDGNMYGGEKIYTIGSDGGISADGYPLVGQLFGNNVLYNNMLDGLTSGITILDSTLA